jgi:release factor glutamine methyltransferase
MTKPQKYAKTLRRIEVVREALKQLNAASVPDARASIEWLAAEAFGCERVHLWSDHRSEVDPEELQYFRDMVRRRSGREPTQYIVGYADFMGLKIEVDENVLIPRPETESLVLRAVDLLSRESDRRALDIGTGSGCIAVALKSMCPDAEVVGCDVSSLAIRRARSNAQRLELAVSFLLADVLLPDFPDQVGGPFDVVVSNPPYVAVEERPEVIPEVRDFEPEGAIFVAGDPLKFYVQIVDHSTTLLRPSGALVFEVHEERADSVAAILRARGFENVTTEPDLGGRDRIVHGSRNG